MEFVSESVSVLALGDANRGRALLASRAAVGAWGARRADPPSGGLSMNALFERRRARRSILRCL